MDEEEVKDEDVDIDLDMPEDAIPDMGLEDDDDPDNRYT